jgi:hypothetical protein
VLNASNFVAGTFCCTLHPLPHRCYHHQSTRLGQNVLRSSFHSVRPLPQGTMNRPPSFSRLRECVSQLDRSQLHRPPPSYVCFRYGMSRKASTSLVESSVCSGLTRMFFNEVKQGREMGIRYYGWVTLIYQGPMGSCSTATPVAIPMATSSFPIPSLSTSSMCPLLLNHTSPVLSSWTT